MGNAGPNGAIPLNTPLAGGDPAVPDAAGVSACNPAETRALGWSCSGPELSDLPAQG